MQHSFLTDGDKGELQVTQTVDWSTFPDRSSDLIPVRDCVVADCSGLDCEVSVVTVLPGSLILTQSRAQCDICDFLDLSIKCSLWNKSSYSDYFAR